jgi:hypothetical protein
MLYGYFLHQFCEKHYNEYVLGRRSSTIQKVIAENIGISMSYANKLRWIGKLGARFEKLAKLSLPLYEILRKQRMITNLFKHHPDLAAEWIRGKKLLYMMSVN